MTDQTIEQQLANVLAAHTEWVETGQQAGTRLNLRDADLQGANLTSADLSLANLTEAKQRNNVKLA